MTLLNFNISEFGGEQNSRYRPAAADLLLGQGGEPHGGGEGHHQGLCHEVIRTARKFNVRGQYVLLFREKVVKKLMLHWHLISDTNSTDR